MSKDKKGLTPMEQLTAGYESLMKDKETRKNGGKLFRKTLKKAATPKKPRGSK
jgi:hypothetical protein